MASHQLIDAYLHELARTLPGPAVDELADGLHETWQHHQDQGLDADQAATTAIAEFGTVTQVNDAFVAAAPGRRAARLLLATGPIAAICWGTSLITANVWTWPIPRPAAATYGILLLATVAALIIAAVSRHSFRLARLGMAGGASLLFLDAVMLALVSFAAPHLVWPMAIAIPVSLARMAITTESLTAAYRHRRR